MAKKKIVLDDAKFKAEYANLDFDKVEDFDVWLAEKTFVKIRLVSLGQDLTLLHIDRGGEVLHANMQANIWNGNIVATKRLKIGEALWWSDWREMSDVKSNFIVKSIELQEGQK